MHDLLITGAGPAGMSAALTAQDLGLKTVLLDDQPRPGGQIYRNIQDPSKDEILGKDYSAGRDLVERFLASEVDYRPDSRVWRVDEDGVCLTGPDGPENLKASHVLLATGAMERPVPTRGWTLPGVMTAGSAQVMLKSSGMVAADAVFVGSGPLMLLIVAQYLRAGVTIKAVLDTTPRKNARGALRYARGVLRGLNYLAKGIGLLAEIRRAGVKIERISEYAFEGDNKLTAISYRAQGQTKRIACDTSFVHQGVIPATHASLSTGCEHVWNDMQTAWEPKSDGFGRTTVDWLRVAGDGAGIAGAVSAQYTGALAALAIARDQNRIKDANFDKRAKKLQMHFAKDTAIRPFLDQMFRPAAQFIAPKYDDITICRCELVTRGQISEAVSEGCPGPNQLKAFTRSGMGPCQGRMCGPTVTGVMSDISGKTPSEIGHYRIRSPFRPVLLGEMAELKLSE